MEKKVKYKIMRLVPRSDLDAELDNWEEERGAVIEKEVELTAEDLKAIWYSITNTCEVFGDKLPNVVNNIRKVLA